MAHKLLLADGSAAVRRVVETAFAGTGVEVISVPDGEEAVARIRAERPDIVLADVGMPKRSGYDVAGFVASEPELSETPVLLLAGVFEPVDDDRARACGSQGVLVKPFDAEHVIARVQELLGGAIDAPPIGDTSRFATRAASPSPVELESPDVPTLEVLLGGVADAARDPDRAIADAFSSLRTVGQDRRVGGARLGAPVPAPAVTDEFVDEVARRVRERVATEGQQGVEDAAVREVGCAAERVVREAVERQTAALLERLPAELARAVESGVAQAAHAAVEGIVDRVVAEVSERLVREEIARIRATGC